MFKRGSPSPRDSSGAWIEAVTPYIEACNSSVEQIYRFDEQGRFGSGKEAYHVQ